MTQNQLSQEQTQKRKPITTKTQSKREKAQGKGIGRNWAKMGEDDGRYLVAVENTAAGERIKVFKHLAIFAPFGFGEKKGKNKVVPFSDQAESYFDGLNKYVGTLEKSVQASMRNRVSEAKRVLAAYINMGVDEVDAILDGEGSYHFKIGKFPSRTGAQQPREEKPKAAAKTDKPATLAEVSAMDDKQQRTEFAKFTAKEIGNMVAGLPDGQLLVLIHALKLRLSASKDKSLKALAKVITEWDKSDAITDANAKRAAGQN